MADPETPGASSIAARLMSLVEDGNVSRFARNIGTNETTARRYLKNGTPNIRALLSISSAYGVNLHWLLTGMGSRSINSNYTNDSFAPEKRLFSVPYLTSNDQIAFQLDYLEAIESSLPYLRLTIIDDDAMSPNLEVGEIVMVDTSDKSVNGIVMLRSRIDEKVLARRISTISKYVTISCDNTVYPPITLDMDEVEDNFEILGRICWQAKFP